MASWTYFNGTPKPPTPDSSIHSLKDVSTILDYLHHPLILVGDAASCRMNDTWHNTDIVDLLLTSPVHEQLGTMLVKLGGWKQPLPDDNEVSKHLLRTCSLEVLQRDADVLLQRVDRHPGQCIFLRLWSKESYHLPINMKNMVEIQHLQIWPEADIPQSQRRSRKSKQKDFGGKVFIPNFETFMDTMVYQSLHYYDIKDFLCSDAMSRIRRLVDGNFLEQTPYCEQILALISQESAGWLGGYLDNFERKEAPDMKACLEKLREQHTRERCSSMLEASSAVSSETVDVEMRNAGEKKSLTLEAKDITYYSNGGGGAVPYLGTPGLWNQEFYQLENNMQAIPLSARLPSMDSPENPIRASQIYIHPDPRKTILPQLRSRVAALPLVRRIQFHLQTPNAKVLATFPPSSSKLPEDYAIAYIDRSRAPETECWVFSSVESSPQLQPPPETQTISPNFNRARAQLLSLLEYIRTLPLPASYPSSQDNTILLVGAVNRTSLALLKQESGNQINAQDGKKVISGTNSLQTRRETYATEMSETALDEAKREGSHVHGSAAKGNPDEGGVVRGHTVPYCKFVFSPSAHNARGGSSVIEGSEGLPAGMEWTRVRQDEFKLVISRTEIPRKERTLRLLPGVGIRTSASSDAGEAGRLIAWAFLGVDCSLTSLHVESEFRGTGLAKLLTKQVFSLLTPSLAEDGGDGCDSEVLDDPRGGFLGIEEGETHTHSDVATDNSASTGVAKAMGGVYSWDCFWALVDLDAVHEAFRKLAREA
ncbi:uncharacterized protein BCR38DRAFT_405189 [Pseudomassariella vexata]|uniref:N-acetyltransferase domain-containing protein n=1 Tax=Pseudomassariella vexata TaxID=1141098 RepID=A0A1Y2ED38_9PEZI|nr:uncharacterized protein BCR38DRAFT_405189 [Pseudomassariella vexata]ORY69470.1 hypothetical protein BCR38DRAFT_405189 [Pseudomassariella vexata]